MESTQAPIESGTRSRTRAAILESAIAALAEDAAASLGDIAQRAAVGRSTLHRYFPERADLVRAVAREAMQRVDQSIERAEPESGPFLAAVRRTVDALLEYGPIVMFLYSDPLVVGDQEFWGEGSAQEDSVLDRLFAREEARFRPGLTPEWAASVFWAILYSGWEAIKAGTMGRREVVDAVITTFAGGVLQDGLGD